MTKANFTANVFAVKDNIHPNVQGEISPVEAMRLTLFPQGFALVPGVPALLNTQVLRRTRARPVGWQIYGASFVIGPSDSPGTGRELVNSARQRGRSGANPSSKTAFAIVGDKC